MRTPALILSAMILLNTSLMAGDYSSDQFALRLYRQLASSNEMNLTFSPLSITIAMAMTYAGANHDTKSQMADVLGFPDDDTLLHPALGSLQKHINSLQSDSLDIALVNKVWAERDYSFRMPYLSGLEKDYNAPVKQMDFKENPLESRDTINRWVEQNTQERIKELLPQGAIDSQTILVLTNAVYFLGQWANKFDPDATTTGSFTASKQKVVDCQMMNRSGSYPLYIGNRFSLLEIPYAGNNFSMLILLPNLNIPLANIEQSLTPKELSSAITSLANVEVNLSLPKFSINTKLELKNVLAQMGMPLAFSNSADFTRMSDVPDLKISEVYHDAFIEVSEQGTEAAAATATVIMRKSMTIPRNFMVDRPFMYILRERNSGEMLFMGRVINPTE